MAGRSERLSNVNASAFCGGACTSLYDLLMGFAHSIAAALTRIDWPHAVSNVADWVTLGAFALTIVGLLSAFRARGRLCNHVSTTPSSRSFTWILSNTGANPVQQIAYHRTWITRAGRNVAGDGTVPLVQFLYYGENFCVHVFDSEEVTWSGDERLNELRMPSPPGADGAAIVLTWRSAVLPWRRKRLVLILIFGQPTIKLRGRRARTVARELTSISPDSRPTAIQLELTKATGGVVPVKEGVQARYPREVGEFSPHELTHGGIPQRLQLYLGKELLADGRLEEYSFHVSTDTVEADDRAALNITHGPQGFIKIDGQRFELNDSHRLRKLAR